MNTFDMMWCKDLREAFNTAGYNISYDDDTFKAVNKNDVTSRFLIKINQKYILTTIPLQENYEYISTFTDYYKLTEYILYHLNDYRRCTSSIYQ